MNECEIVYVPGVLQWTGVTSRVCSQLVLSITGMGSRFYASLTSIKWFLKMNECMILMHLQFCTSDMLVSSKSLKVVSSNPGTGREPVALDINVK